MNETDSTVSRLACVMIGLLFGLGLLHLGVRLWEIQVDGAAGYAYASARQSLRRVQIAGSRGRILDRTGQVLAENRPMTALVCHPASFQRRTWERTVEEIHRAVGELAECLGRAPTLSVDDIRRHVRRSLALPLVVWRDIPERELAVFSEQERQFPGFSIESLSARVYPQHDLAAHLLGYVGWDYHAVEAGDVKFNFILPEMRGRSGVERYYDSFLRGVPGEDKLLVDARGFAIREWEVAGARCGLDLTLSIDSAIQREAERQLEGRRGACAVIDARNGEVLALASAPSFNPNDFTPSLSHELYARLTGDSGKPLLNRAVGGVYAPGSTFKPITALAALAEGISEDEEYCCSGGYELGAFRLRCARRWGHGDLDVRHALMKSCNPFFCNLGMTVGTNALVRAARAFGLGEKTGIDFSVDQPGVVPEGEWKMRTYGEKWYAGDLVQMAIGQGMILVSPLQMARVAGAIGTGYLVVPRLKLGLPAERRPLPFSESQLRVVREGMRLVVAGESDQLGPGRLAGEDVPVAVAGKTGTAEIGRGATRRKNTWFIAYAPAENPRVAIALVVENGESGGTTAAPRVGRILRTVFK